MSRKSPPFCHALCTALYHPSLSRPSVPGFQRHLLPAMMGHGNLLALQNISKFWVLPGPGLGLHMHLRATRSSTSGREAAAGSARHNFVLPTTNFHDAFPTAYLANGMVVQKYHRTMLFGTLPYVPFITDIKTFFPSNGA